jgi:hypothetical protein
MTISKAIDPGRVGLSKSLMTSPCERKGVYGETIRDEKGHRLHFPMPEKVTFGKAVDEAVSFIVWHDRDGKPWNLGAAFDVGIEAIRNTDSWALVPDSEVFHVQLDNALRLFVASDDGLPRLRGLYAEGLRLQGDDGETLRSGDIIGTPDYLTDRRVGDLKTWARNDGERVFWKSPEMGVYALLFTEWAGGVLPESVFYQAYIRKAKPEWVWLEAPGTAALVAYGRATADHWRALLAAGDPEVAATSTYFCGDCPFRAPLPQYGHTGCAVGAIMPGGEEEA